MMASFQLAKSDKLLGTYEMFQRGLQESGPGLQISILFAQIKISVAMQLRPSRCALKLPIFHLQTFKRTIMYKSH